jgi:hypothetical protein
MSTHYLIDAFTPAAHPSEPIVDVMTPVSGHTDATGALVVRVPDGVAIHGGPTNLGGLLTAKYASLLANYPGFGNILFDPCIAPTNINSATLSGGAASITSVLGVVTITGLAGIPTTAAGAYLWFSGAASSANNGVFRILSYVSPTSVTIANPSAVTDANNGAISWIFAPSHRVILGNNLTNHCILPNGSLTTLDIPLASTPSQCIVIWETFSYVDSDPMSGLSQRTYQETTLDPFSQFECNLSFNAGASFVSTVANGAPTNIPVPDQGATIRLSFTNLTSPAARVYLGSWAVIY